MSFSQDNFTRLALEQGHSQSYIDDCIAYAKNLEQKGLPVIFSTSHLSQILNVTDLGLIIRNRNAYYKFYQIKKNNGKGFRQIVSPYSNLKFIQNFINNEILSKVEVHNCANGFVSKKSILHNAIPHKNAKALLNIDLLKFFDSIPEKRVFGIFKSLGYAKNLSVDLAKLTTVTLPDDYLNSFSEKESKAYKRLIKDGESVLPQGAPTSPTLSNLVLYRTDKRLSALAKKLNVNYTRYADDITFSGDFENLPKLKLISHIIKDESFNINWDKVGIYKKGRKQLVTGLTISNDVHIHQTFKKVVKKHIYCCIKFGVEEHLKFLKLEKIGFYKEWLFGKINFIKSIEPKVGQELTNSFNRIIWPI